MTRRSGACCDWASIACSLVGCIFQPADNCSVRMQLTDWICAGALCCAALCVCCRSVAAESNLDAPIPGHQAVLQVSAWRCKVLPDCKVASSYKGLRVQVSACACWRLRPAGLVALGNIATLSGGVGRGGVGGCCCLVVAHTCCCVGNNQTTYPADRSCSECSCCF